MIREEKACETIGIKDAVARPFRIHVHLLVRLLRFHEVGPWLGFIWASVQNGVTL